MERMMWKNILLGFPICVQNLCFYSVPDKMKTPAYWWLLLCLNECVSLLRSLFLKRCTNSNFVHWDWLQLPCGFLKGILRSFTLLTKMKILEDISFFLFHFFVDRLYYLFLLLIPLIPFNVFLSLSVWQFHHLQNFFCTEKCF